MNPSAEPPAPCIPAPSRGLNWLLAFGVASLVLLFALLTRSVWEDYWITFRSSKNLVEGNGLVYHPGDRLHTFTSPLGVLLPALGYAVTGSDEGAIWLFRVFSAAALGAGAWLLADALQRQGWAKAACLLAALIGLAALKNIEFASNGMESAFLVLFTVLAFAELIRAEGLRTGRLGAAFAGLMWTRPDAFVVAGGLALGTLLFSPAEARKPLFRKGLRAVALGIALYAPWLVFATVYYGSPLPQTIVAKAGLKGSFDPLGLVLAPLRCFSSGGILSEAVGPNYGFLQTWGRDWHYLWGAIKTIAAFAWIWPGLPRPARLASFALLIGGVYLEQIVVYPWYLAPWTALIGIVLAGFCASGWRQAGTAVRLGAAVIVSSGLVVLVAGTVTAALRQTLVEEQVRGAIGLWLKENARLGDTVMLEPIGYIGYFSGGKVVITDYPGLTSRAVSDAVAQGKTSFATLIPTLRPRWLVLRPNEVMAEDLQKSGALAAYVHRRLFDNTAAIGNARYAPGRRWMLYDAAFHVFERKPEGGPAAP